MNKALMILLVLCLVGCANKFSQASVNQLGYLPADDDADIIVTVNEGIDTQQFKKVLYVQTEMHGVADWNTYEDAVMNGFREMDFFSEIVTRKPTLYINTMPPVATPTINKDKIWYDMSTPAPFQVMNQEYGDHYLIAQATLRNQSAEIDDTKAFYFEVRLIESKTSRVVFQCSKKGTTILGIDRALINPVLNYTRGYLLHYDATYVPDHPTIETLSDRIQSMNYQPTIIWE